jgi:1-acyl-sn-glycerol-3-phosphate acyltransferase
MTASGQGFFPFTVLRFTVGYVSYFLAKSVFVACGLPALILLTPFPNTKQRFLKSLTHPFLRFFTRTWLPALGLYRIVEISGLEQVLPLRPAIYVANHRGYLDSITLLGLLPCTGVLIKSRHGRQPMYHLLIRHFNLVSVDPNALSSVSASLERCRRILAGGENLLVFPEGARARSGRLQRFNGFAFQLARLAGLPVVPVIIHSTLPFMAKLPGSIFPRGDNQYRIRFLDPVRPTPEDDADSMSDRVYRRMTRELKSLDTGTIWDLEPPVRHD